MIIWKADFEQPFANQDIHLYQWPDGPPDQVVERTTERAYSGQYSAKCSGFTTTPRGMKARACAGGCNGADRIPVVGNLWEGYMGAWFFIEDWGGTSMSLLDFRCHVPADPWPIDAYIGTFWIWGHAARLRTEFPGPVIPDVPFNGLALIGRWVWVEFGFKIAVNGFYKVWIGDDLLIEWYGDNTKCITGRHPGANTPPADRSFAGITARGTDGLADKTILFMDDFTISTEQISPAPPTPPPVKLPTWLLPIGIIILSQWDKIKRRG